MDNDPNMTDAELSEWADESIRNMSEHEKAVSAEAIRQLIHGLPPSDGLPDVRPHYPRYEDFVKKNDGHRHRK